MEKHGPKCEQGWKDTEAKLATPSSEIDVMDVHNFIEVQKKIMCPIDADIKDAKRRITAAKGGSKKNSKKNTEVQDSDSDEVSGHQAWVYFLSEQMTV